MDRNQMVYVSSALHGLALEVCPALAGVLNELEASELESGIMPTDNFDQIISAMNDLIAEISERPVHEILLLTVTFYIVSLTLVCSRLESGTAGAEAKKSGGQTSQTPEENRRQSS